MHPRLLTIPLPEWLHMGPTATLHTYGVLLAIAFIAGLWVAAREALPMLRDTGRRWRMLDDVALLAALTGALDTAARR